MMTGIRLGCRGVAAGRRRGARTRKLVVLAAACLLGPGNPVGAAPAIPVPAAARTLDEDSTLVRQLRQAEQTGRARPRLGAAEIDRLLAAADPSPATRVEGLTIQGLLLAAAPDAEAAEAVARRLDALVPSAAAAASAAALVRAKAAELAGDPQRAVKLVEEAAARQPPDASPLARLRLAFAQAHIRNSASRLDEAIGHGHAALRLADGLGLAWWQAEARNELAWSYYQARQLDHAKALSDEAMAIARRGGDDLTLAHSHTVRAIVQDAHGHTEIERESMQAALDHARRAGAKYEEALYLANLADYYLKRADYPTALRFASLALPLTRELRNLNGETVALANIGLARIGMHDLADGKRQLQAAIEIDERRGSLTGMSDTYAEMGAALERAGDAAGAIEALHQHRLLADQILQRDQQRSILEQRERFDAERRARELDLLRRDGALQEEQLHTGRLQQALAWLLVIGGVLAVAVVAMLVRRERQANARLVASNVELQERAEIDPLTGLANRRHFQAVMQRLGADTAFAGAVLLADLDHFKRINDRHGHAAGDAVLVEVARRLRQVLREDDLIVRWGGEEFLVVVRSAGADGVQALAQRMLDAVGTEPVACGDSRVPVTVSIGYAGFPLPPANLALPWERAIDLVDTAMYLAKAHGRNRGYGVKAMHARDAGHAQAIGRALEDAWHAGEVELVRLEGPAPAVPAAATQVAVAA